MSLPPISASLSWGARNFPYAQMASNTSQQALLNPGDALFLRARWFHMASPTADIDVAVNIFCRSSESLYRTGRGIYRNRDLAAYDQGRQEVVHVVKCFRRLPHKIRQFYLARLADKLVHKPPRRRILRRGQFQLLQRRHSARLCLGLFRGGYYPCLVGAMFRWRFA